MTPRFTSATAATVAVLAAAAVALTACGRDDDSAAAETTSESADGCTTVIDDAAWYGDNVHRINSMIEGLGDGCDASDASDASDGAPLALFDWDNTVVKNDIGEAQTYWMLANGKVKQPENRDWNTVSPFLTDNAAQVLADACGELAEPGEVLPTDTDEGAACADEIAGISVDGATTDEEDAFENFNARRMEPAYAFAGQILAGYSTDEIKDFAREARDQNTGAEEGAEQKVGTKEVTGWVRYYDQISNVIDALRDHGFDVRVISASSEPVAEAWGEKIGFTDDKVMGLSMDTDGDTWTSTLASCGGDDAAMTYIEGKRCRVNEEVFGITGPDAFEPAPEDERQVFAAGDSDTDVTFLSDATALRLVLNRNKIELMCRAYDDADGKWIVNPMFIEPEEQQEDPYECSTGGRIEPDGSTSPLSGEDRQPVDNQDDVVFG